MKMSNEFTAVTETAESSVRLASQRGGRAEAWRLGASQSVVVRRYQKRALKSSLQVMNPGLVGEWTMQRTMLLCPRDSRFFLSAVRESQQHRLMVRSSGSST